MNRKEIFEQNHWGNQQNQWMPATVGAGTVYLIKIYLALPPLKGKQNRGIPPGGEKYMLGKDIFDKTVG